MLVTVTDEERNDGQNHENRIQIAVSGNFPLQFPEGDGGWAHQHSLWCVHHIFYLSYMYMCLCICTCVKKYIFNICVFLPLCIFSIHTLTHCQCKSEAKTVCNCLFKKGCHGLRLAQVLLNPHSDLFNPPDLQATYVMRNRESARCDHQMIVMEGTVYRLYY